MLRLMQASDLDQIISLENVLFSSPWKLKDFEYELNENPYSILYVIEKDGEIIAYCNIWCLFERAEITCIAVKKSFQKQGYAQILIEQMEKTAIEHLCENISLEVRVSNYSAISLYKKNKYIILNTKKGYYTDNNEDAYLMMKGIGGINYVDDFSNRV